MTLENVDKSIYRLVEEIGGVAHNLGTCFHIGSGIFLTCWHVLASHETIKNKNIQDEAIHFPENTYLVGGYPERLYNLTWKRHWDPHHNQYFDIAVGCIPPGELAPENLPYNFNFIPGDSTEIHCRGYGESNGTLKGTRTVHCASQDTRTGYFVMDNSLAPGYSGSPVFKDDRVVGIVCADNVNKSCSYSIGINRIWHWLENTFGTIAESTLLPAGTEKHEISRYPLTINYNLNDLQLEELLYIALPRLQNLEETESFIRKANNNLLAVTDLPDAKRSLIIEEFGLTKQNVKSFIREMFLNAAGKSSRTFGAILETNAVFSESRLTEVEQRIVQQTKKLLNKN